MRQNSKPQPLRPCDVLRIYSLNGRDLGVAFSGVYTEGLYPAASMNVGQAASFNFGYSPFLYSPPDSEGSPFRPVSEAVLHTTMADHTVFATVSELGERNLPNGVTRATREDRVEGNRNGDGDQNDIIRRRSPARIRQRHNDGTAAVQSRRSAGMVSAASGGDAGRGAVGGDGGPTELERQGLVETLIGMGFPIEWAIRAAERSGKKSMKKNTDRGQGRF